VWGLRMVRTRRTGQILILICSAISIVWGFSLGLSVRGGPKDFQAIYYGTRCLMAHHNPYNLTEMEQFYRNDGGEYPSQPVKDRLIATMFVNVPTTFVIVAPLAVLPLGVAQVLWFLLLSGSMIAATLVMWEVGAELAPRASLFLICLLAANGMGIFFTSNTAGLVIGLCVVGAWCLCRDRFWQIGVLCLAVSVAMKPHDAGLVWLYFLLAGRVQRKRALQALLLTGILGLTALVWVWIVAPGWLQGWQANLATISAHGGLNDPGPHSMMGRTSGLVVDLQAAISIFRDDSHFYNRLSYLICGAMLAMWAVRTVRLRFQESRAWLALAGVTALTMLVTYHRPYDAKLLLLSIPGCALLWAQGGRVRWIAFVVSTGAILFTGDISLGMFTLLTQKYAFAPTGFVADVVAVVFTRPASLALLAMGIFYLWAYLRRTNPAGPAVSPNAEA